jgi:hypothetical protein
MAVGHYDLIITTLLSSGAIDIIAADVFKLVPPYARSSRLLASPPTATTSILGLAHDCWRSAQVYCTAKDLNGGCWAPTHAFAGINATSRVWRNAERAQEISNGVGTAVKLVSASTSIHNATQVCRKVFHCSRGPWWLSLRHDRGSFATL